MVKIKGDRSMFIYNHFLTSSDLKTWSYPQLLETLSALRKDGCRYERAA